MFHLLVLHLQAWPVPVIAPDPGLKLAVVWHNAPHLSRFCHGARVIGHPRGCRAGF